MLSVVTYGLFDERQYVVCVKHDRSNWPEGPIYRMYGVYLMSWNNNYWAILLSLSYKFPFFYTFPLKHLHTDTHIFIPSHPLLSVHLDRDTPHIKNSPKKLQPPILPFLPVLSPTSPTPPLFHSPPYIPKSPPASPPPHFLHFTHPHPHRFRAITYLLSQVPSPFYVILFFLRKFFFRLVVWMTYSWPG